MIETTSCGGVVIHKGKVLLLYKNQNGKYMGWVLPKGTVEDKESFRQTALREVREETRAFAKIQKYIGKTHYTFRGNEDIINKTVHWYLMSSESFHCKPQQEEFFADAGFYKKHEAFHLLKFYDEKQIVLKAYEEYDRMRANPNLKPRARKTEARPTGARQPQARPTQIKQTQNKQIEKEVLL